MSTYYRFISCNPIDNDGNVALTLLWVVEPEYSKYIKAIFGFGQFPKIRQHEVVFVGGGAKWALDGVEYCGEELCGLLEAFRLRHKNYPLSILIGLL